MNDINLINLAESDADREVARIMQICNACRYCEGFCAVFPAMERRRLFTTGDTAYLSNLCHNCGACYHACQYAPPHEFAVNAPVALALRRAESYEQFAWPRPMARVFQANAMVVSLITTVVLIIILGVMLALINPALFWGVHLGEGAFYRIMPHTIMAGIPMAISGFVIIAFIQGWRRYWRATGARWGGWNAFTDAVSATMSLRYLGGDNNGKGGGCPGETDRLSNRRRHYHHLTFYGFMLCFASTSTGTIYHYLLGREAPYGYFELPVVLGTVGGIILCLGTAGLWREKRHMDPVVKAFSTLGMDYVFIGLLFWVSATGLLLLAVRETGLMGLTLAIHLGVVYAFFLVLPYSKFVHGLYRFAALLQSAEETGPSR